MALQYFKKIDPWKSMKQKLAPAAASALYAKQET
jgi:hypothetical protein